MSEVLDERAFVNGMVGLMATGGSTNLILHLPAMARAAGVVIDLEDFADLSAVTPLMAKVYPNGLADVNHFHAAGGLGFMIGALLDEGLLHDDTATVAGKGLGQYTQEPKLTDDGIAYAPGPKTTLNDKIVRPANDPFQPTGGLQQLNGNLGRAVIKISAVKPEHHVIEAKARIFHDQADVKTAFQAGEITEDTICVVRFQGPKANGMPELHSLTPTLSVLLDRGLKVALVTDGRMSGASGKVPAAIHVSPEAADAGPLALLQDGDVLRLDAASGTLECLTDLSGAARPRQTSATTETVWGASCSPSSASRSVPRPRAPRPSMPPLTQEPDMTPTQASERAAEVCALAPVIPVLTVPDAGKAEDLAKALVAGGLPALEVTLRTPAALDAIRAMAGVKGGVVGAGTLMTPRDVENAKAAGATFGVSPGATDALLDAAEANDLPLLAGSATVSEVMRLLDRGYTVMKFFPAEVNGGIAALKSIGAPVPQARFCPTGGVKPGNAADYLALPNVLCVGGSWVCPGDKIAAGDWAAITALAAEAAALPR